MSRIGKKPVIIPANVTVNVAEGNVVTVKGPKGELTNTFNADMIINVEGNVLTVSRPSDEANHRALHGLTRTLISNMVEGVEKGFSKELEVNGVGYRAEKKGNQLVMRLGFSHEVFMGEAQTHDQLGTLLLSTVANTVDFQLLAVALVDTLDHVADQSTGQAVQGLVLMLLAGTLDGQNIALNLQDHVGVETVGQSALGALHSDNVVLSDVNSDVCRNDNRLLTNSRHLCFLLTRRKPGLRRRCAAREPSCRS